MQEERWVDLNGIDGDTGRPLGPLALSRLLACMAEPAGVKGSPPAKIVEGYDPDDPDDAGWALVWPGSVDPAIREALEPLIQRR